MVYRAEKVNQSLDDDDDDKKKKSSTSETRPLDMSDQRKFRSACAFTQSDQIFTGRRFR